VAGGVAVPARLAFDEPLLSDSLALGAGSLQVGGSASSSGGPPDLGEELHGSEGADELRRPSLRPPDRWAAAAALQPPQAIAPSTVTGDKNMRQPQPALRAEWAPPTPEAYLAFQEAFSEEIRKVNIERRHGRSESSAAWAARLLGRWDVLMADGTLRVYEVEDDGPSVLRVRTVGSDKEVVAHIFLRRSGEIVWGRGDWTLDGSIEGLSTLAWRHHDGQRWDWVRRRLSAGTEAEGRQEQHEEVEEAHAEESVREAGAGQRSEEEALAGNARSTGPAGVQAIASTVATPELRQGGAASQDRRRALVGLSEYIIGAALQERGQQEPRQKGLLPPEVYAKVKRLAQSGEPVAVAAELAVLEASLFSKRPSEELLRDVEELRQRLPFDDAAHEYLLASSPDVQRRVLKRLNPEVDSKTAGKADYSALLVSVVRKFRVQASEKARASGTSVTTDARAAALVRRARRAAALGAGERRDREDALLLLMSGAQALPWPRIRELLLQ